MLLKENEILRGQIVNLRNISIKDAGKNYQKWMQDKQVARYLASGATHYTQEELIAYIESARNSPNTLLLAIELADNGLHVGNIKLGPVDFKHRVATLGLMVGESSVWGKGVGTESIELLSRYAFENYGLRKICAGVLVGNEGSKKAFEKCGYTLSSIRKEQFLVEDKPVDEYLLERFRPNSLTSN